MAIIRMRREALTLGAVLAVALAAAGPAAAGRCGGFYPVDAPTTLVKVARACNVSLAALKEANPGVDPGYVAPGQHLAVPDEEVGGAADVPVIADGDVDGAGYADNPISPRYVEYTGGAEVANAVQNTAASQQSYFYRTSAAAGALLPHAAETDRLTFQKRSAQRIRTAGLSTNPIRPLTTEFAPRLPEFIAATPGEPVSPLMECTVLRRQPNGKIAQVREFKPVPEGRDAPSHCTVRQASARATTAPKPLTPAVKPPPNLYLSLPPLDEPAMLKGFVSAYSDGCLTLIGDDGRFTRIDGRGVGEGLVGREATLWVEYAGSASCGGVALDHAVYAERVPSVGAGLN